MTCLFSVGYQQNISDSGSARLVVLPALGASTGNGLCSRHLKSRENHLNHTFVFGFQPSIFRVPLLFQFSSGNIKALLLAVVGSHIFIHNNGFKQQWWNGFYKSWHWSIKKYHQTKYHMGTIYENITSICIINCVSSWNLKTEKQICIFITPVVFSTKSGQMSSKMFWTTLDRVHEHRFEHINMH